MTWILNIQQIHVVLTVVFTCNYYCLVLIFKNCISQIINSSTYCLRRLLLSLIPPSKHDGNGTILLSRDATLSTLVASLTNGLVDRRDKKATGMNKYVRESRSRLPQSSKILLNRMSSCDELEHTVKIVCLRTLSIAEFKAYSQSRIRSQKNIVTIAEVGTIS